MFFSGETALSKKTMLNPPRLITYAIWNKSFDKEKLTDELIDYDMQVRLELWAYTPALFADKNTADSLSVALSFEDNNDERLETAVEELIEREFKNN